MLNFNRIPKLAVAILALAVTAFVPASAAPVVTGKKTNILFIAIDDLRPELGCYGAPQVKTPHIDKLAADGMRFDRAYCQVPICMGSRASLMTGILPTSKRFVGDCRADVGVPNAVTLPEAFRKAGYTTFSNGKIFHGKDDTADRSWSQAPWQSTANAPSHDPETTRQLSKTKQRGRIYESPDVADDAYPDGETARKTIQDLQRLKQEGKPFFLACGFIKPHMPFYAPKKYWDLYPRDSIQLATNRQRPANAPEQLKGSGEFRRYHLADLDPNSDEFHRMMRHGYLACTSYTDKLTGDVLAELERLGLADNTIVVLWGDHGWQLGEHNFWGKHNSMHLAIPERIRENKSAVGRRFIDVDGYPFRVFVTIRQGDGADLWRDCNQRACCEQHIEELKSDLQADGFCMKGFYATESAFLSVCFTNNLLSLYQHASAPEQRKAGFKRPATLRAAVFIGGALLGTRSRTPVLYIAASWGGLSKHKPLIDNILQWPGATSPKLPPEPPGDGMTDGASAVKTCAA